MVGVILGAIAAIVLGRREEPLLFGVSPHDPLGLVAVVLILPAVALAASCALALRASRVDPNLALRTD